MITANQNNPNLIKLCSLTILLLLSSCHNKTKNNSSLPVASKQRIISENSIITDTSNFLLSKIDIDNDGETEFILSSRNYLPTPNNELYVFKQTDEGYKQLLKSTNFTDEDEGHIIDTITDISSNSPPCFLLKTYYPHANAGKATHTVCLESNNTWKLKNSLYTIIYPTKDSIANWECSFRQNLNMINIENNPLFRTFPDEFERPDLEECKCKYEEKK